MGNLLKQIWSGIQDIGYGVANIFGQGENADRFVNMVTSDWMKWDVRHKRSDELLTEITNKFGVDLNKAKQALNLLVSKYNQIDSELSKLNIDELSNELEESENQAFLSKLPPALSSNLKKAVQKQRKEASSKTEAYRKKKANIESKRDELNQQRKENLNTQQKLTTDINRVESGMNTAINLASQQDVLSSGRKVENQEQVKKLMNQQPDLSYINNIERSIK